MLTVTLVALLAALQPPGDVVLRPEIAWAGVLPDASLRAAAPASGVILNDVEFTTLWEAWRPGDKKPEVDFAKTIVVVGTIDGPNRMFVGLNNREGNLKTQFGGTKVGGPGFGYLIAVVKRDGIDRVNDRPLPKPSTDPLARPTSSTPPLEEPTKPPTEPLEESAKASTDPLARPTGPKPRQPRPAPPKAEPEQPRTPRGGESIRLSVRGQLESGVVAIGGETTGTVIRSKGLMFEVAFSRPGLQERAEALNGQMALVAGELVVAEGVETGTRLIIEADRIDLLRTPKR